jgi:antitoxin VapB
MELGNQEKEAERLARALAQQTGEPVGEAVVAALRERIERFRHEVAYAAVLRRPSQDAERTPEQVEQLVREVMAISAHCAALPVHDTRTPEEMLYDDHGLPA